MDETSHPPFPSLIPSRRQKQLLPSGPVGKDRRSSFARSRAGEDVDGDGKRRGSVDFLEVVAESLDGVRPREEGEQEGSSLSACVCASAVRGHSPALLSASEWMDAGCAERRKRSAQPALTVKRGEGVGKGRGDPRMERMEIRFPVLGPMFPSFLSVATE